MRLAPEDQYPNDPEQQRRSNIERDKVGSVGCYGEMQALQSHNVAWSGLPATPTLAHGNSTNGTQVHIVSRNAGHKVARQQKRNHYPSYSCHAQPPSYKPIGLA